MAFIILKNVPSIPTLLSVFIINGCCTLPHPFQHVLIQSCDFWLYSCLCDVLDLLICKYCTILPNIDSSWNESHLFMVHDVFNAFLDAVCQYFVEDYSMYVHLQYWPEVFFLCYVFTWFWDLDDVGFIKWLWESSIFFNILK